MTDWAGTPCELCPIRPKSKGFVLGTGDPRTAKICLILEAPGTEELTYPIIPTDFLVGRRSFLGTKAEGEKEVALRREFYTLHTPNLPEKLLKTGAPIVGKSGAALVAWLMRPLGLKREEIFVDNSLRCLCPKNKQGAYYPVGPDKNLAQFICRQYDRVQLFKPDVIIVTLHPASLFREITPLPLLVADLKKAAAFAREGRKVLVLMGGKSAETFLGFAESVTRWRGHYELVREDWYGRNLGRLRVRAEGKGGAKKERKKRSKKEMLEKGMGGGEGEGDKGVTGDVFEQSVPCVKRTRKKRQGRETRVVVKTAKLSVDGAYRYSLTRTWDFYPKPTLAWGGLNPSIADHEIDDPTIRKEMGFSEQNGYGGLFKFNAYAYRATDPKDMWAARDSGVDIVGPENMVENIISALQERKIETVVVAWGGGIEEKREKEIVGGLKGTGFKLVCLGKNKNGTPKHPLYVPYKDKLVEYVEN